MSSSALKHFRFLSRLLSRVMKTKRILRQRQDPTVLSAGMLVLLMMRPRRKERSLLRDVGHIHTKDIFLPVSALRGDVIGYIALTTSLSPSMPGLTVLYTDISF